MANVTVHQDGHGETPSRSIVRAANAEEFIEDSRGRRLGVRKLKVLERLNMLKLIGNGNSDNLLYVSSVSPAFLVTSIDGDPVEKPTTQLQLDALVQRLDEEGLEAITLWASRENGQSEAEDRTALKNSSSTPS